MSVPILLRRQIEERDVHRCAYCQTAEENCGLRMHIDHITPEIKGGATQLDNLCLACFACNVYKGDQQTGIDPLTGAEFALFHPVQEIWTDHFVWDESGTIILGITAQGRATVVTLQMNNLTVMQARRRWVSAGWHPPDRQRKIPS